MKKQIQPQKPIQPLKSRPQLRPFFWKTAWERRDVPANGVVVTTFEKRRYLEDTPIVHSSLSLAHALKTQNIPINPDHLFDPKRACKTERWYKRLDRLSGIEIIVTKDGQTMRAEDYTGGDAVVDAMTMTVTLERGRFKRKRHLRFPIATVLLMPDVGMSLTEMTILLNRGHSDLDVETVVEMLEESEPMDIDFDARWLDDETCKARWKEFRQRARERVVPLLAAQRTSCQREGLPNPLQGRQVAAHRLDINNCEVSDQTYSDALVKAMTNKVAERLKEFIKNIKGGKN